MDRLLAAIQLRPGGPDELTGDDKKLAEVMAEQGMIRIRQCYTVENAYLTRGRWGRKMNELRLHPDENVPDFLDESSWVTKKTPERSTENELKSFTDAMRELAASITAPMLVFCVGMLLCLLLALIFK